MVNGLRIVWIKRNVRFDDTELDSERFGDGRNLEYETRGGRGECYGMASKGSARMVTPVGDRTGENVTGRVFFFFGREETPEAVRVVDGTGGVWRDGKRGNEKVAREGVYVNENG